MEWREQKGIHYLVDGDGKILAEVRRTDRGVYHCRHGVSAPEDYFTLEQARRAMLKRVEEASELAKLEAKKPEKEKKVG